VSQLPEMPATGWPEQGYDPSAYPGQGEATPQYEQQQAPAEVWQQDTQPDWNARPDSYPQAGYGQAAGYPQQGFPMQQAAAEESGLPTEFDHLFRDSTPDSRRAIDRQKPAVGGAAPGYLNGMHQPAAEPVAPPQQAEPQPQPKPFPMPADPYQAAQAQAQQGQQYGSGQYAQADYAPAEYAQSGYGGDYGYNGGVPENGGFDGGSGPGGFGGPGGVGRNKKPLLIGGALAVVAVIGIVLALNGGGGSNGNTPGAAGSPSASVSKLTDKQQADQVYQLIQQSGQLRSAANTAVIEVNGCKDLSAAQTALTDTATKRQAQADGVAKLDVSKIKNGAQLIAQLQAAWSASAQYDNAYAQIAGDLQGGTCKTSAVKKDSNYKSANTAAGAADTAKAQAAQLWNDNAVPLGETQVSEEKL
jgi:hypothetical protein